MIDYGTKLAVDLPIEKVFEFAVHCFGDHFSADFKEGVGSPVIHIFRVFAFL